MVTKCEDFPYELLLVEVEDALLSNSIARVGALLFEFRGVAFVYIC